MKNILSNKLYRYILTMVGITVILVIIFLIFFSKNNSSYETLIIEKGNIQKTVSTSGKLKAVVTVDIGSQITGQISELFADFNTVVKKNQLLARIDPRSFESQVRQSEANLAVAKANLQMQIANKERAKSEIDSALANLENRKFTSNESQRVYLRNKELIKKGVISNKTLTQSQSQFESLEAQTRSAKANYESAIANQKFASANVSNAYSQIRQKEALLEQSLIQLQHTNIKSPIDGIVIDRKIDLGQTVAASLNTPILFTIAQNTKNMQVETNVDEADIGFIKINQQVSFSVDAFPEKTFYGKILQIRQSPKVVQNVTTYGVIVSVKNNQQILLPGMTATVDIIVNEIRDVILIPNQALRYKHNLSKRDKLKNYKETKKSNIEKLSRALKLTDEQKLQITDYYDELIKSISKTKKMLTASETNKQDIIKRAKINYQNKVISILKPEQANKYKNIIKLGTNINKYKSGKIWTLNENNKVNVLNVKYEETDQSFSILRSNNISTGSKVIIKNIK